MHCRTVSFLFTFLTTFFILSYLSAQEPLLSQEFTLAKEAEYLLRARIRPVKTQITRRRCLTLSSEEWELSGTTYRSFPLKDALIIGYQGKDLTLKHTCKVDLESYPFLEVNYKLPDPQEEDLIITFTIDLDHNGLSDLLGYTKKKKRLFEKDLALLVDMGKVSIKPKERRYLIKRELGIGKDETWYFDTTNTSFSSSVSPDGAFQITSTPDGTNPISLIFLQRRIDSIDLKEYPYISLLCKCSHPKRQKVLFTCRLDFDGNGIPDEVVELPAIQTGFDYQDLTANIYKRAKKTFPDKKNYFLVEVIVWLQTEELKETSYYLKNFEVYQEVCKHKKTSDTTQKQEHIKESEQENSELESMPLTAEILEGKSGSILALDLYNQVKNAFPDKDSYHVLSIEITTGKKIEKDQDEERYSSLIFMDTLFYNEEEEEVPAILSNRYVPERVQKSEKGGFWIPELGMQEEFTWDTLREDKAGTTAYNGWTIEALHPAFDREVTDRAFTMSEYLTGDTPLALFDFNKNTWECSKLSKNVNLDLKKYPYLFLERDMRNPATEEVVAEMMVETKNGEQHLLTFRIEGEKEYDLLKELDIALLDAPNPLLKKISFIVGKKLKDDARYQHKDYPFSLKKLSFYNYREVDRIQYLKSKKLGELPKVEYKFNEKNVSIRPHNTRTLYTPLSLYDRLTGEPILEVDGRIYSLWDTQPQQDVASLIDTVFNDDGGWCELGTVRLAKGAHQIKAVENEFLEAQMVELKHVQGPKAKSKGETRRPEITFRMINPTRYLVGVKAHDSFWLVFSENFNKGWKASLLQQLASGSQSSHEPPPSHDNTHWSALLSAWRERGKKIALTEHRMVNGYANGWWIPIEKLKGLDSKFRDMDEEGYVRFQLLLEFTPQRLFEIGVILSLTTLMVFLVYLIWYVMRKRSARR